MTTLAPASASASTQARPMPCPPPVTSAVLPSSLNFSMYMVVVRLSCWRHGGGTLSCFYLRKNCIAVAIEAVDPVRIRRQHHGVAHLHADLTGAAHSQRPERPSVVIEKGVA